MLRTQSLAISLFLLLLGVSLGCDENCAVCTSNTCQSCRNPYYIAPSGCLRCSRDCLSCTSNSNCQTCVVGYFSNSGTCQVCSNGCLSCQGRSNCTQCGNIYYLQGGVCKQCPNNCGSCNLQGCINCARNFYRVGVNTCRQCANYCKACADEVGCTRCIGEFYLFNQTCLACDATCAFCTNASACTGCRAGFYLSVGVCVNCSNCGNQSYCTVNGSCPAVNNNTGVDNSTKNATETTVVASNNSWQIILYIAIPIAVSCVIFLACFCSKPAKPQEEGKDPTLVQTKTTLATDTELRAVGNEFIRMEKTLQDQIQIAIDHAVFGPQTAPHRTTTL